MHQVESCYPFHAVVISDGRRLLFRATTHIVGQLLIAGVRRAQRTDADKEERKGEERGSDRQGSDWGATAVSVSKQRRMCKSG